MDGGGGGVGSRGSGRRVNISNEICAALVDHVLNHGRTKAEAGWRVQPNVSTDICFTAYIFIYLSIYLFFVTLGETFFFFFCSQFSQLNILLFVFAHHVIYSNQDKANSMQFYTFECVTWPHEAKT